MSKKLLESVFRGRSDFFRSCGIHSPLAGADFQDAKGMLYYSSGIDYAPCNGVIAETNDLSSEEAIDQAVEFFRARKLPFIWWTSANIPREIEESGIGQGGSPDFLAGARGIAASQDPKRGRKIWGKADAGQNRLFSHERYNLEEKGFQFGGTLTGIALDISQYIPPEQPEVTIKVAQSEEDLNAFSKISEVAFGLSPLATEQFQTLYTAIMKKGEAQHFLAYLDGVPVGTATLSTYPSSAGIWNLGTLPECRKHGIATALARAALLEAQKRNYTEVMAILMPKGMAWGLFMKLGFKEVCHFPFYVYGVSSEELEK